MCFLQKINTFLLIQLVTIKKRRHKYQEFLLTFDLQDKRKICPNESFEEFMIKAGLQKECIEEFNKHQKFQDFINSEFFKLLDNQNFVNR